MEAQTKQGQGQNSDYHGELQPEKKFPSVPIVIIIAGILLYAVFTVLVITNSASAIDNPIRFGFYGLRETAAAGILETITSRKDSIVAALDHEIRHGNLDMMAAIRRNKRTL